MALRRSRFTGRRGTGTIPTDVGIGTERSRVPVMKAISILLLAGTLSTVYAAPWQARQQRQQELNRGLRANNGARRSVVEEMVTGFYVRQFQQVTELSPDVFAKALPFVEQFIGERFQISQRRTRVLNAIRQALNRNAGEDELRRLMREVDAADTDFLSNQERFFSNVDPLLNVQQQARL